MPKFGQEFGMIVGEGRLICMPRPKISLDMYGSKCDSTRVILSKTAKSETECSFWTY